jgi:hypothetical protein
MTAAAASPSIGPRAEPLTRADVERFLASAFPRA